MLLPSCAFVCLGSTALTLSGLLAVLCWFDSQPCPLWSQPHMHPRSRRTQGSSLHFSLFLKGLEALQQLCYSLLSLGKLTRTQFRQGLGSFAWFLFPEQNTTLPSTLPTCACVERSNSFPGCTQKWLLPSAVKQSSSILEVLPNLRSCLLCKEREKIVIKSCRGHRKGG